MDEQKDMPVNIPPQDDGVTPEDVAPDSQPVQQAQPPAPTPTPSSAPAVPPAPPEDPSRMDERLERLAVQGTGARLQPGLLQRVAGAVLSRYPLPSDNPFINQFFNLLFGGRCKQDPLFELVTRQCWQTDQGVMAHRFHLVEQFEPGDRLERIRVPTLALAGDRDLLVSPRSLEELRSGIRDCRLVYLPGCGHLAFVTQPERVAAEVRSFVAQQG